jgi:hypothetical protein
MRAALSTAQCWSSVRSIEPSRAFLTGVGVGVEVSESTVVVMADVSGTVVDGRSGVGITYRWSMCTSTTISTAQNLSDHFPLL